jgi:integrase
MPRKAGVRWCKTGNAWRSDVGPFGKASASGKIRRTPVYFREVPNTPKGKRQAQDLLDGYLRKRDKEDREATEDKDNPRVWSGVVQPYLAWVAKQVDEDRRSEETLRSHKERLAQWMNFTSVSGLYEGTPTADRLIRSLTDQDAIDFLAHLRAKRPDNPISERRIDGIIRSIHACLNWASAVIPEREPRVILATGNPFAGIKAGDPSETPRRMPTRDELARFLRAARREVEAWTPLDVGKANSGRCGGCKKTGKPGPCRRSHRLRSIHDRIALMMCRLQASSGTRPKELCTAGWGPLVGEWVGWTAKYSQDPLGRWWGLIVVKGKTYRKTKRVRTIPVRPILARAIERVRAQALHDELIFPRLTRGGSGRWPTDGLDARVRAWREAAGLSSDFVLYAMRHTFYTKAVGKAGLTAEQAGAIGGTSGAVVRRTYLQQDLDVLFDHAFRVSQAEQKR